MKIRQGRICRIMVYSTSVMKNYSRSNILEWDIIDLANKKSSRANIPLYGKFDLANETSAKVEHTGMRYISIVLPARILRLVAPA